MVKIVWTELSINDLKEIFDFISEDSGRFAKITVNRIYEGTQVISVNPHSGRVVQIFNRKSIRELVIGNYRVIYRIKSNVQIDILRVFHSARHLKKNSIK
jgi:addiction module RelE/StbE family toxin